MPSRWRVGPGARCWLGRRSGHRGWTRVARFAPCTKAAALPGASPEHMQLALCAREGVDNAPSDLLAVTAADILPLP